MVTASLRFAGEQLSIELQLENNEAYQRLSADSEAIVKSLRGLGYDIDKVAIVQSSIASSRRPAPMQAFPAESTPREQSAFRSGDPSGGNGGSGGQQPGRDYPNDRTGNRPCCFACSRSHWRRPLYLASSRAPRTRPRNPCEPEILRAADRYGVPVGILYAVGLTETGKKGSLQPNALNIEGKAVFARSRSEAVAVFETPVATARS